MRLREVSAKLKFGATLRSKQSPLNRCSTPFDLSKVRGEAEKV